ncbi:Prolyl-tRNA synthetase, bacterial type [hydrothermal vent metagenome]|uniref:Proline--tRNA ligase n=1 Tax=hydrothermal vent metagenome TaxID=652676 RepID=A0A3B0QQI2_9ZZZZ
MRLTRMFLPTLKESPASAEVVSHKLMLRAGMIRKVAAGIYSLLPLGVRVTRNVEAIVRSEMNRAGAQEVVMPVVVPSELWLESGRWDDYGKEMLRLRDRGDREFCMAPTHEEVITDMVRGEVRSYKQLPLNLYQIQTKFRDEIRPRFGLMRGREFVMKDAYSFHASEECAEREYRDIYKAYTNIFKRCGLEFSAVEAEAGPIGGSFSHEFMVLADTGEDAVVSCTSCDYAANVERAEIKVSDNLKSGSTEGLSEIEKVSTPGQKTIEEVSGFLKVDPARLIKTLIYKVTKEGEKDKEEEFIAVLLCGDRDLNEAKLARLLAAGSVELAEDADLERITGAPVGFAGPVGLEIPIYADWGVAGISDGVTGANELDTHLKNVVASRDFNPTYADLRVAGAGDGCPRCDGVFELRRGIEVGHIFKLGTKYSESMGATFLDENGKEKPLIMCCYGIGIGRTAAAAIEQNHDDGGIIWPAPLAPFDCHIIAVNIKDEATMKVAEALYSELQEKGLEVLFDDRKVRAGFKFKDADLIGIPARITISAKTVEEGSVEIKERSSDDSRLVKIEDVAAAVEKLAGEG